MSVHPAEPAIRAVHGYLETAFPGHDITETTRRQGEVTFKIHSQDGYYQVSVKLTFLDTHTVEEIGGLLQEWNLAAEVRKAKTACVIVGNGGVSVAWA